MGKSSVNYHLFKNKGGIAMHENEYNLSKGVKYCVEAMQTK